MQLKHCLLSSDRPLLQRDYKDLDVLQMMGRAGRPQYDTEGVCVIMTEQQHKGKWTDLVRGETVVESTLHHNLV